MRRAYAAFALAIAAASGAACSRASNSPHAGERNPWTIPGVLRIGMSEEPDSLNPLFSHSASSDVIAGLVYSFLLRYDATGNYIPDLAQVVPTTGNGGISSDGRTIVIHLRKDARWEDGSPLTAVDWLYTYRAVTNARNNVKSRYGWDALASASSPAPYTLVLHLRRPSASVLGILAIGTGYPPLPMHALIGSSDLNHARINDAPLSSGPYVLHAWNRGTSLEFAPNATYFRGKPRLQRVTYSIVPDVNTLLNDMRTHDIDVYPDVDANSVAKLAGIDGIVVKHQLLANWHHLAFNVSRPNLRDVRVRQAISYAVDWTRIERTVYHGLDRLAVSDIFPESWAAPALPPYSYDLKHAGALLDAAGWHVANGGVRTQNGRPLTLTISATVGHQENEEAEVMIQSMLARAGFDIRVRNYPANVFFAQDGPLYTGEYDMEWSIDTNGPDPDNSGSWNGAFIPPNGSNTSWLNDPIVNATSIAANRTFDRGRRKALYQREEERLRELAPAIFFSWETGYAAMNSDVKNYVPAAFIGDTWNAWQWNV
ncbi:MAG TPA: peptide ABC transporter substrate-binding protein [Candidatus Tumulicola sp.]|jgi:peptide/nickel transport system substrate-binding protein